MLDYESCLNIAKRMRRWDGIRPEDGEDFVQDAVLEMMERARRNGGGLSTQEMWRAARCVRNRYWRGYRRRKDSLSLSTPIQDTDGPIELWETLEDKGADLDAWVEARLRLEGLPTGVLRIARKLERGDPLTPGQRAHLARFRQDGGPEMTWSTKRYRRLRSRGLCPTCGEESASSVRCPKCRQKLREGQARYRRRRGIAWQRTLRAYWRKQERCPRCGKTPGPGRKLCPRCLARNREYLRRHRERLQEGVAKHTAAGV